jgi:hypothetical protein
LLRKPPRIMCPSESAKPRNARNFSRDFNESGYMMIKSQILKWQITDNPQKTSVNWRIYFKNSLLFSLFSGKTTGDRSETLPCKVGKGGPGVSN